MRWELVLYAMVCTVRVETQPLDTTQPIVRISPALKTFDSFGYSVCLYQLDATNITSWRIVVGAPNGTYPGGLNINNPNCAPSSTLFANSGLVYLCSIQPGQDTCGGAVGNGSAANGRLFDCYRQITIPQSSITPFQQMGASLYSYGGYLVACAPAWSSNSATSPSHKGACYVSFNNSLRFFSQMLPCEGSQHPSSYFYDDNYCYSGLSLAVKGKTAIFGGPLAFTTGMASYIQLDTSPANFSTIVSKGSDVTAGGIVYGSTSMNINGSIVYRTNTLKGYSVGIGHITRQNVYDYLVAIPRWNVSSYVGSVEVFAFPNSGAPLSGQNPPLGSTSSDYNFFSNSIGVYDSLMNVTAYGTQVGEQFGASIDTADLDGDGYDELIVGAPFYTDYTTTPNFTYEAGRVYVFLNTKGGLSSTPIILTSTTPSFGGRFGHVVLSVGDINGDGTEDFAAGAPFEPCTSSDGNVSTGSVYLYIGGRTTLVSPVQKISACDVRQASYSYLNGSIIRSFGYSLASKADLDGNTYNDLAVGAFQSGMVFLLRTFSVANVTVTMTNIGGGVVLTKPGCNSSYPCGTLLLCTTYSCRSGSCSQNLNITFTLSEIPYLGTPRIFFSTSRATNASVVISATINQQHCANVTVYTETYLAISDVTSPFQIMATVNSLPRTLAMDSNLALADFKTIPILNSNGSATANISIMRACANPLACQNDLQLNLSSLTFRDMFNNAKPNLTPNETSQVVLVFVVTNNGDAVTGSGLTIAGMPSYVTAVTFSVEDGQPAYCSQLSNETEFECAPIVDKYLLSNQSISIAVTMATDVNAIDFDLHNVTFNVDYQGTLGGSLVEVALTPVVSAALDITLLSFSPSQRYYKTPLVSSNPTSFDAIGYSATLGVDVQRSGQSTIPNMTLVVSFPRGGTDWSSYYLYPAAVSLVPPLANISCVSGVIDPQLLATAGRRGVGVMVDTSRLVRGARQTEPETSALQSSTLLSAIDCSQWLLPTDCANLVCYINDITSSSIAFSVQMTLYVNDKYFSVQGGQYNLTASVTASIPNLAFANVIVQAVAKGVLNLVPLPVTKNLANVHVILWPLMGVVTVIVVAIILLYSLGFFKRKHSGPADDDVNELENEYQ